MALCLFSLWAIRTGRRLPDRPYTALTRDELEAFWAGDELEPAADWTIPSRNAGGSHSPARPSPCGGYH